MEDWRQRREAQDDTVDPHNEGASSPGSQENQRRKQEHATTLLRESKTGCGRGGGECGARRIDAPVQHAAPNCSWLRFHHQPVSLLIIPYHLLPHQCSPLTPPHLVIPASLG
eukprot:3034205-Rhodomonas_salina.1